MLLKMGDSNARNM